VFEPALRAAAVKSRHVIVRFYLDYPNKPSGVPEYLRDGGLRMDSYTEYGGGQSPDYFNETLLQAVVDFVGRFGARYDNDTRIGFVQMGMLGFWGEWHTYPHTAWFPPQATQNRIFDAYLQAFPTTLLMQRYPSVGGTSVRPRLGLFDDSFAYSTLSDKQSLQWYFWPRVLAAGQGDFWKSSPMGGELRPELQSKIFATDRSQYVLSDDKQAWNETVDTTHVSWLLNNYAFSGAPDATERSVTNVAEQRMGYELWVSHVEVSRTEEGALLVNATLGNAGVAPFYYNLMLIVEMELLTAAGSRSTHSEAVVVPRVLPGDTSQLFATMRNVTAPSWTSLASVTLSLCCSRCYEARPVPLSNVGVNATTGALKLSVGEGQFLFQQVQLPVASGSPSPTVLPESWASQPSSSASSVGSTDGSRGTANNAPSLSDGGAATMSLAEQAALWCGLLLLAARSL
jgi:hypothetical protein